MLGATEAGLRGCIFGSVHRLELAAELAIPERYRILLVLAVGEPAEEVVIEEVGPDGDTRYWRDGNDIHHVPKRPLQNLIIG